MVSKNQTGLTKSSGIKLRILILTTTKSRLFTQTITIFFIKYEGHSVFVPFVVFCGLMYNWDLFHFIINYTFNLSKDKTQYRKK